MAGNQAAPFVQSLLSGQEAWQPTKPGTRNGNCPRKHRLRNVNHWPKADWPLPATAANGPAGGYWAGSSHAFCRVPALRGSDVRGSNAAARTGCTSAGWARQFPRHWPHAPPQIKFPLAVSSSHRTDPFYLLLCHPSSSPKPIFPSSIDQLSKMAFGKLYTYEVRWAELLDCGARLDTAGACGKTSADILTDSAQQANPRSTAILAVAKANNLDIETVNVDLEAAGEDYKKINPLSKVPTFVGADGYTLYECIAIAIYGTFWTAWYVGRQAKDCCPACPALWNTHTQTTLRQISSGDVLAHNNEQLPPLDLMTETFFKQLSLSEIRCWLSSNFWLSNPSFVLFQLPHILLEQSWLTDINSRFPEREDHSPRQDQAGVSWPSATLFWSLSC